MIVVFFEPTVFYDAAAIHYDKSAAVSLRFSVF